jgi:hypothetical protein
MKIYIINLVLIIFLAILFSFTRKFNSKRGKKTFILIVTIQLILMQGLRAYTVGTDTYQYLNFYNLVKITDWGIILDHRFEIGYKIFSILCSVIRLSDQAFLFANSAMMYIPLAIFIYKYSNSPFLSYYLYICLGFFGASFCTLRQSIAYSIILFSLTFIKERKLVSFLIIVFIASSFHFSALFFLPAYFLSKIRLDTKKFIMIILLSIVSLPVIEEISYFIISKLLPEYDVIINTSYNWFAMNMMIFLFLFKYYKQVTKEDIDIKLYKEKTVAIEQINNTSAFYVLTLVGILIMLFATTFTNAMRIVNYYYIFIIVLIPTVIKNIKNHKYRVMIYMGFLVCISIIYMYFLSTPSDYQYVPYMFFWELY